MPTHTLMSSIRSRKENNVGVLRWYEPPSEVRVYDLQGHLKRVEPPPVPVKLNFVGRIRK